MTAHPAPSVYLHIGAPKTGTTFLQQMLWHNRDALRREGVALPGSGFADHFRATQDLRELKKEASSRTPSWRGEWDALAGRVRRSRAPHVVISCELLAAANERQARRAITSLAPCDVHVVYTARDLSNLLPAAWQEFVKHRYARDFDAWLADVIDMGDKGRAGGWFWRVHDSVDVLRRWSSAVPADRVHVVTMPQASPPELLWERFASLLGIDPGSADSSAVRPNASLGRAEVELLRRVNAALDASVPRWHYLAVVKDRLAHEVLAQRPNVERVSLPEDRQAWVRERAEVLVSGLRDAGYHVAGDLDELLPTLPPAARPTYAEGVNQTDMVEAAVAGLAGLVRGSFADRTEMPAGELIKRTVLDLGSRSRPVASALGLYRRLTLRLRRS